MVNWSPNIQGLRMHAEIFARFMFTTHLLSSSPSISLSTLTRNRCSYRCTQVAYYFANRMVRLIVFLGPIAASLCGIAVDADRRCIRFTKIRRSILEGKSILFRTKCGKKDEPPAKISNTKMKKKHSNNNMSSSSQTKADSFVNDPRRALSKIYRAFLFVPFAALVSWPREICHQLASFMKYSRWLKVCLYHPSCSKVNSKTAASFSFAITWTPTSGYEKTPRKTLGSWPGGITATKSLASPTVPRSRMATRGTMNTLPTWREHSPLQKTKRTTSSATWQITSSCGPAAAPTIWQNPHISSALAPASARKAAPWT